MFHPVTSFVSLVEFVPAHTFTFRSLTKSQLSIEGSSNYGYVSFAVFSVFLDRSEHFLDVVVRTSRVGDVYTHQLDVLAVVEVARSLRCSVSIILCFHFLFSKIPTPCLLPYFPAPMKMCL